MVATEKYCLKTLDFFCVDFLMYKGSHMLVMGPISELWCILGHPTAYHTIDTVMILTCYS